MNSTPPAEPLPDDATQPRSRWKRHALIYGLLALLVLVPVSTILVRQQKAVVSADQWKIELDDEGKLRPVIEVAKMTREAQLITARVETTVTAKVTDTRWRGTASATVEAPVTYRFGVDLSKLEDDAFRYNFLSKSYTVDLPPPTLVATEVDASNPVREVIDVTGTRFKALAGREQMNLALKAIYRAAKNQSIPQRLRNEVREQTRTEVGKLVSTILENKAPVHVRFADD